MSFNLLKSQEGSPELLSADDSKTQQRIWKNTWGFNLHKVFPLDRLDGPLSHQTVFKKMMRKYYGKKILYVTELRELNCAALISHAKLLKYADIEENEVYSNSWKYNGNRVIICAELRFRGEKIIPFKKIFKYCKRASMTISSHFNFQLLKNMLLLKELRIELSNKLSFDFLGKSIRNLLNLEVLEVDYGNVEDFEEERRWCRRKKLAPPKSNSEFFSLLHKFRCLKEVRFGTDYKTFKTMNLDKDLEKFYSRPLNFKLWIGINGDNVRQREDSNLNKVLGAAEYLFIEGFRDGAKNKAAFGSKNNNVVLYAPSILSPEDYSQYQDNKETSAKFTSPLLTFLCQIKEKCHSLEYFSLYLSTFRFPGMKLQNKFPEEWSSLIKKLNLALEEISTFDKLKKFELVATPNDLKMIPLGKILSNKSLEIFRLGLDRKWNAVSSPEQGRYFEVATANHIKEFSIRIDTKLESPLFGTNLFDFIPRLETLEVFELVYQISEAITFDFLYGLVTSLLEKKSMRKILISAKVTNNFYSEIFEKFLSKSLGEKLKDMLDEVSQDWKKRVKILKGLQLEEILVGKLDGYSFSYLFFHKDVQVVDKLFWTEEEMKKLLAEKPKLASQYKDTFYFFKKDVSTW